MLLSCAGLVGLAIDRKVIGAPSWRVTGSSGPNLQALDAAMRQFMENQRVTAGQLAIHVNGALALNRGYTNAAMRPTVEPASLFRIASCSKIFTCAAIEELRASGRLKMNERVFPLLGIQEPALPRRRPDPRINEITVQQLVNHAGGWVAGGPFVAQNGERVEGSNFDPVFQIRRMSLELGLSRPLSKLDMARYMYGMPLQFTPGTQNYNSTHGHSYSNFGYVLLGLVVEKVAGMTYVDFLRSGPLNRDGTEDVFLAHTRADQRLPREVWYEAAARGPDALLPRSNILVPNPYGGEGFVTECMDSGGGLATTAATLASFISKHAVWGMGGRAPGYEREGSMAGTDSYAFSRPNGVDCAWIINTRNFPGGPQAYQGFVKYLRNLLDSTPFA
jgi:CubicO group peptidase (beta-lactamase class C family)